jgi:hypothetical protein
LTVLVAGVLGIVGTLLGVRASSSAAAAQSARTAELAERGALRQELRSAVAEYCAAIAVYRSAELNRWDARAARTPDTETAAETSRVYATRTAAMEALYRLELSTADSAIWSAARVALAAAKDVREARNPEELRVRREASDRAIGELIRLARGAVGVSGT